MTRIFPILVFTLSLVALIVLRVPLPHHRTTALGSFGHGPTVVLVHGLGSSSEHWLPMARELARDHRVVLVELPGHGLADMPPSLTLDNAADELDEAIRSECREPVVLIGHSAGGLVAAAEALRSPGRVRALVLVETALKPQLDVAAQAGLFAALERDYVGTLRASYESFGRDSAQGARLFAEASRIAPSVMKAWIRLTVTTDLSTSIDALHAPLLVVLSPRSWPEGEPWSNCADSLGYAAVPGATPARVENTGHFIMLDEPAELARLVRRFERTSAPAVVATLAPR